MAAKTFCQNLRRIIYPFWRSREGHIAGVMLIGALLIIIFRLYVSVLLNEWQKLFFNAIQMMNTAEFYHQLLRFGGLSLLFLPLTGCQTYLRGLAQIHWRRWLSEHYAGKLLSRQNYYRFKYAASGTDNPDQRIAEDLKIFAVETINMSFGFIEALGSLAAFSAILWSSPGSPEVGGYKIPGFMFWLALTFSLAGTWVNHLMGRILSVYNREKQKFEADYRFSLVRLRENAEAIGTYGGDERERAALDSRFRNIAQVWQNILRRNRTLNWFFSGYNQLSFILPYIVMAPSLFSGAILLGSIQQAASAFSQTRMAFSWFIYNYGALAEWKATADRIIGFEHALVQTEAIRPAGLKRQIGPQAEGVRVNGLDVWLPDGRLLLKEVNIVIQPGSRTVISGPSGCGKTTFFHTLNGLWPFCRGNITLPAKARLLFIPQKPFLPVDTLRQALVYPDIAASYETSQLVKALEDCGLSNLCSRLDEVQHWEQLLSVGEQQRLGFARALLLQPQWLFLDEATAALDELSEAKLYRLLISRLPDTAIASIAHRLSLMQFHERKIELNLMGDKSRII